MKKKRKKYRLNARFYCLVLSLGIIVALFMNVSATLRLNTIPNFHGWSTKKVMQYEKDHENILMIYDLEYSYDVIQNCVIEQSIKPRTKISNDPLILTLKVSKGRPIMQDFIGTNLKDVEEFANHYELNLKVKGEEGIISSQTIKAGEVLSRGMTLSVTLK